MGCFIVSAFPVKGHTAKKFKTVVGAKAQVLGDCSLQRCGFYWRRLVWRNTRRFRGAPNCSMCCLV